MGFCPSGDLIYAFFFIQPFFYSIYYSLTDWNGADPVKQFVGLGNYIKLAGDSLLWQALGHNLIWVIIGTVSPIAIGLLLGVLIWTGALGRVVFRTIYFLPVILSEVVVAIIWNWIYHPLFGAVNQILRGIGLDHLARGWLGDPQTALLALLMTAIWSTTFFVLSSSWGLQNVDIYWWSCTIDGLTAGSASSM